MFCLAAVKTDFSGKAFRDAISKAALRGSDRPQREKTASGKKKTIRLTAEDRKYMYGNLGHGKVRLMRVCLTGNTDNEDGQISWVE